MSENEEEVLIAKDPKKVEQGGKLGKMSVHYKKEKARKMFMEEDDKQLRDHFVSKAEKELKQKFLSENFSYIPYIFYPLAGISTFALLVMLFKPSKPTVVYKPEPKLEKEATKENNYETLG